MDLERRPASQQQRCESRAVLVLDVIALHPLTKESCLQGSAEAVVRKFIQQAEVAWQVHPLAHS